MTKKIAIIGGGPSGLMAANILAAKGCEVTIYERKPTVGRKFLMAGRGGLNITHSENLDQFIKKYGEQAAIFKPIIEKFTPDMLRDWCLELGEETFIGSSGRVFPKNFKASPLLRAWIDRLKRQNVTFKMKHDWQGWEDDALLFQAEGALIKTQADVTLLALGGASWPALGADGSWINILAKENIDIAPLRPSNCGFFVDWSDIFSNRFEGHSLKSVELTHQKRKIRGEFIITRNGIEGGAIYALSATLREDIAAKGTTQLTIDLKPDLNIDEIKTRLQKPKFKLSLSNYLRKTLNLSDVAIGLLMERSDRKLLGTYTPAQFTTCIKSYTLNLTAPFAIDRAISTAGGVKFSTVDQNFMLINKPNVYVVGEMLDWEAPTGGYLLQACMAGGVHVANAILKS